MKIQPILNSEKLILRPFTLSDASYVQRLAGDWEIADTTWNIPHPYEDGMAEEWIAKHQGLFDEGKEVNFAVTFKADDSLIGAISLMKVMKNHQAEIGYWIGKQFWNQGFCTEAGKAIIKYGFTELELNRICGEHISRNQASGQVMLKLGMRHEGCRRQHFYKKPRFEDLELYGILKDENVKINV